VPWAATRSLVNWYKTVRPTVGNLNVLKRTLSASRHCVHGAAFAAIGAALMTLIEAVDAYARRKQWPGFKLQSTLSIEFTQNIVRGIAEGALVGTILTVAPYSFVPMLAANNLLRMCHLPWENSEQSMYAIHEESTSDV
jgi:hypothetical protein